MAASFLETYTITVENNFISYSDTSSIKFCTVAPTLEICEHKLQVLLCVFTPPESSRPVAGSCFHGVLMKGYFGSGY